MERVDNQWILDLDGVSITATRTPEGYPLTLVDGQTTVSDPTPYANLDDALQPARGLLYHHWRNERGRSDPGLIDAIEAVQWRCKAI